MKCKLNYISGTLESVLKLFIVVFTHCTVYIASDMSTMSNDVYCGRLIYMEDGQAYPDENGEESKWCVGITWQIVDEHNRELKRGA